MGAGGKVTRCCIYGRLGEGNFSESLGGRKNISESVPQKFLQLLFKIDNGESKLCTVTDSELIHVCRINKRTKQTAAVLYVYDCSL